jgi:hypothetical protein
VPLVDPAGTVTEDGVVSSVLLSERETTEPPLGAALLRLTVQFAVAFEPRVDGVHASEVSVREATRFTVATCETPLSVAVTVAV